MTSLASTMPFARAAGIPSTVIGPHEYDVRLNFAPINEFVEYGYWNNDNVTYSDGGSRIAGPGTDTYVGLAKYAHLFTVSSLPDVGWEVEVLAPQIRIEGPQFAASGLGDPLAGVVVWWKPSAASTLGFDSFIEAPIGASEVTNNYWAKISSVIFDYNFDGVNFDGDVGVVWPGPRHQTGVPDSRAGNALFTNLRIAYRATAALEPFVGLDYQHTGATENAAGQSIAGTVSDETAGNIGLMWHIAANASFTASYDRGLAGRNTTRTNTVYIRNVDSW
jgi:hypothetical protein